MKIPMYDMTLDLTTFFQYFLHIVFIFLGINDNWIQAFKGNVSSFSVDVYRSDIKYFWQGFDIRLIVISEQG